MSEAKCVRYICELEGDEVIIEARNPEAAARAAAASRGSGTYTVTVSEATDYDLPLIAGDDYTVTIDG